MIETTPPAGERQGVRRGPKRVLALVDLVQDVDALLPALEALNGDSRIRLSIIVSRWLKTDAADALARLARRGLRWRWARRADIVAGAAHGLDFHDAVLTGAESSHPAHAAAYALANRAVSRGLQSYTLQHGLESVGLTVSTSSVTIASQIVFVWGPPESTEGLPMALRRRLRHVGRPALQRPAVEPLRYRLGVFENLHAETYEDADRARFLAGLTAVVEAGVPTLLKPHPAGRWSAANLPARVVAGVHMAQSLDAGEAIAQVERVITTPSTIVVDAALAGRPTALAGQGTALFAGFPVLDANGDWLSFAERADDAVAQREAFLARALLPGDACRRIVDIIATAG